MWQVSHLSSSRGWQRSPSRNKPTGVSRVGRRAFFPRGVALKFVDEFGKYAAVVHGRSAAVTAVLLLGLTASGCQIGMPGYQEYVDGNYDQAHREFSADYARRPGSSIAQMNMAITYRDRGDKDKANSLFHEAALSGKGVHPTGMTEPHDSSTTVAEVACRYLAEDHQSDGNCPTL